MLFWIGNKAILILSITYLIGAPNHATPQNEQVRQQETLLHQCIENPSAEHAAQPFTRRHPSVNDAMLLPDSGLESPQSER